MSKQSIQIVLGSIGALAVLALIGCARNTIDPQASQSAPSQQETVAEHEEAQDLQVAPQLTAENPYAPSKSERIAILREKLASLDEADDTALESNPHRERLQDPDAIQEAIQQLEQGADICTRCLMECGAP